MSELQIKNFSGYAKCNTAYNIYSTSFTQPELVFKNGLNLLEGSVDSAAWACSYVLSMYTFSPKKVTLDETLFYLDGEEISLNDLNSRACYLDSCYRLFKKRMTVKKQVEKAIKKYKLNTDPYEIRNLFGITEFRFDRPLSCAGNEKFKCMAAIGYVNQKDIFCFPWFSKKLFPWYGMNLTIALEALDSLNKIVILPTEFHHEDTSSFKTVHVVR